MKLHNIMLACALALSTTACGSDDEKFMEDMVTTMEGMAKAVTSAGDDCAKMASNLESFVKGNEGKLKSLKSKAEELKKDKSKAEKLAKSAEKYKARMEKVMPAMMGMMKCADDPKMKEIQGKLDGLM